MTDLRPLAGFDNRGHVFDAGEFILRIPDDTYREEARSLFHRYETEHLDELGIVETQLAPGEQLAFHHRKLTISYPFEWAADMLKDAALFHLDLMSELAPRGLMLKDALPGNVLFDGTRPAFVDFFSLVPAERLAGEVWLSLVMKMDKGLQPWQVVLEGMFLPHFAVPLLAMGAGDHRLARRLLSEKACNCSGSAPSWKDLLLLRGGVVLRVRALIRYHAVRAALRRSVFIDAVRQLRSMLQALDVTPRRSDYLDYYAAKQEAFDLEDSSGWKAKQKGVDAVLTQMRPATMLDLGANTGWFSRLAARHGARVLATDIDEAASGDLYLRARADGLSVLPLRLSFDELTRSAACPGAVNMFLPATERLQSDLVCCLGLLHHLVLGEGRSLRSVLEVLSMLARRTLVIEFVALDDPLIRENPDFFPSLAQHSAATFSLDALLETGQALFRTFTLMESHPETRTLVVFEK